MKSGLVCTNFIQFVEKEFERYAATVEWRIRVHAMREDI